MEKKIPNIINSQFLLIEFFFSVQIFSIIVYVNVFLKKGEKNFGLVGFKLF